MGIGTFGLKLLKQIRKFVAGPEFISLWGPVKLLNREADTKVSVR